MYLECAEAQADNDSEKLADLLQCDASNCTHDAREAQVGQHLKSTARA